MPRRIASGLLALLALLATALRSDAQAASRLSLHVDHATAEPGSTIRAGVRIQLPAGWHTYWKNPGESGLAAKFKWDLPAGIEVEEGRWPAPVRHVDGDADFSITTFVLEGSPVIAFPVRISGQVPPGPIELKVRVDWQECQTACLRGSTNLVANLNIGSPAQTKPDPILNSGWDLTVTPAGNDSVTAGWTGPGTADRREIEIIWASPPSPARLDFFPLPAQTIQFEPKPVRSGVTSDRASIVMAVTKEPADSWPDSIGGLLAGYDSGGGLAAAAEVPAIRVTEAGEASSPAASPPAEVPRTPFSAAALVTTLAFAFLGGLILNIMPCVLPVLALKVLGFVRQSGNDPARVRRLGWYYTAGVLASFAVLAAVAIAIQAGGGVASWGSAFQNPPFRIAMTFLMLLVALNLFGVFEVSLGQTTANLDGLTRREGPLGAFFHGLLAAVLATPCMAPFLATAMAFAFTQPPWVILGVFLTIGAGLAAPFLALCMRPGWLKLLPKPGPWMVRFKTAMGFPMLATAVWIFWFTSKRLGDEGVLWLGIAAVTVAAAAWVWGEFVQKGAKPAWPAMLVSLGLVAFAYVGILERQLHWRGGRAVTTEKIAWEPWSAEKIRQAQAAGRPVLVDFTADNCVNCKLNKFRSLEIPSTRQLLKEHRFVSLMGDFTDADPAIAEELKRHGRYGVPLVLVYPGTPGALPRVLPTLFGPDAIHEALRWAATTAPGSTP